MTFGSSVVSAEAFVQQPDGAGFAQVGEPIFPAEGADGGVGIAIRKNEEDLKAKVNAALAAIMANGGSKAFADTCFDFDVTPASATN